MFLNEYEDDIVLDDSFELLANDAELSEEEEYDEFLNEGFFRMVGGDIKDTLTFKGIRDWINGSNPSKSSKFFDTLRDYVKADWGEDGKDNWFTAMDRANTAQQAMWIWYPRNVDGFLNKIADNSKYLIDTKVTKNMAGGAMLGEQLMTKAGVLKAINQVEANYGKFVAAWKKHNNTANSTIIGGCMAAFARAVRTAVRCST